MKKKRIIVMVVVILILFVLLVPRTRYLNDGGTVEYKAILYNVIKLNRLNYYSSTGYDRGTIIEILGKEVYNDVVIAEPIIINNDENYQKYSKIVDNVYLELKIPSEWKYEELQKNPDNDFYVKGNKVKITYNGVIMKSYPAQIVATKIELAN